MNWCKSVKLDDIYYCEVINRKIYLYTKGGVIEYYCKLEDIEKQLDYRFNDATVVILLIWTICRNTRTARLL